jgi:hypothetical protein
MLTQEPTIHICINLLKENIMKRQTLLRIVLVTTTILIFSSCSPTLHEHNQTEIQKARNYWKGETEQTLVMSWGAPHSKTSDGSDGKIYTYKRYNGHITWVTNFYINNDNIIYHLNAHSE